MLDEFGGNLEDELGDSELRRILQSQRQFKNEGEKASKEDEQKDQNKEEKIEDQLQEAVRKESFGSKTDASKMENRNLVKQGISA